MAFCDEAVSEEDHLKQSRRDWNDMTVHIRQTDPFGRLVTIHPTQNGHEQIEDETLLDLDIPIGCPHMAHTGAICPGRKPISFPASFTSDSSESI